MTGAERIAAFAAGLRETEVPEDVLDAARWHLLDATGVGLAAARAPHASGWGAAAGRPGHATLLSGGTATPETAAMVNGALIHALEFDDTHIASVIHGSAVAAPAALAAAQAAGATGRETLLAYLLAWEVMIRIGLAAPGAFQARGFQVTSVAGAIGAAAAASFLHGADRARTLSALGIAGSQASGLLAFLSDGSSVKALNPGWAAHTGLMAARLADAGITGPADILESPFGVLASFGGAAGGEMLADLGTRWYLPEAAYKLYPCCHYIHPFLEAAEMLGRQGLSATNLASLTAFVPPPMAPLICEPWDRRQAPASGYDGKWGLAYCLALQITRGSVPVAAFEEAPDPAIVALAQRMQWQPMEPHDFPARFEARLEAELSDGHRLTVGVESVLGAPDRPVTKDRVAAKFRANAARRMPEDRVAVLETALLDLAEAPDLGALAAALGV